jgi:hypothetical protein
MSPSGGVVSGGVMEGVPRDRDRLGDIWGADGGGNDQSNASGTPRRPAGAMSALTKEHAMTIPPGPGLTRAERLWLAAAALRGALAGAARAITTWLLEQHIH